MESNQDSTGLTLQIQTLTASVEELTKQSQEMRLQFQQKENWSRTNQEDEGDSQKKEWPSKTSHSRWTELRSSPGNEKGDGQAKERH